MNSIQDYNNGKTVAERRKRGAKMKLCSSDESQMADYVQECWYFGQPVSKVMFLEQVVHYMECNEGKCMKFPILVSVMLLRNYPSTPITDH